MPRLTTAYPRPAPSPKALPLSRRQIMVSAWRIARFDARRAGRGAKASAFIAAALRQAWRSWKNLRDNLSDAGRRVLAEVEKIKREAATARAAPAPVAAWAVRHAPVSRWSVYR